MSDDNNNNDGEIIFLNQDRRIWMNLLFVGNFVSTKILFISPIKFFFSIIFDRIVLTTNKPRKLYIEIINNNIQVKMGNSKFRFWNTFFVWYLIIIFSLNSF